MRDICVLFLTSVLVGCGGSANNSAPPPPPQQNQLTISLAGSGTVNSNPAGISCPTQCKATFNSGTTITLTAVAASGFSFSGFAGACTGPTCQLTLNNNQNVSATFAQSTPPPPTATLENSVNHIIFMLQENRSFDHYFGHLPDYWSNKGFPQATNGTTFDAEPGDASNVDPAGGTVTAYQLSTACVENPSPSWNESHTDFNRDGVYSSTYKGDGFVHTAAGEKNVAGADAGEPYFDSLGHRAMGYYTDTQLNYYYFMASTFGTSDRWFSPALSRTEPNRMYVFAGTSDGHAYPIEPCSGSSCPPPIQRETIFQELDKAGVSWKIYRTDTSPTFLTLFSYYYQPGVSAKVVPVNPDYFNDLDNGTLPQVALIEGGYGSGLDEHPTGDDTAPGNNIQSGAKYVSTLINGLMKSSAWGSSVFILTWDEGGGFFDHVSPQREPSPDGILPADLRTNDICLNSDGSINSDPKCRFEISGYRVPLVVVSPFTKNIVSHTVRDYTALLKLIEMRFNLPNLTARDAAQPDMLEFFDFSKAPWKTPPLPPVQSTSAPCVIEVLSSITFSPNPALPGTQATVTLTLNKPSPQNITVQLSSKPALSDLPSSVPITKGTASTSFNITVPSGMTSLTVTGSIGGISTSGTVNVQ